MVVAALVPPRVVPLLPASSVGGLLRAPVVLRVGTCGFCEDLRLCGTLNGRSTNRETATTQINTSRVSTCTDRVAVVVVLAGPVRYLYLQVKGRRATGNTRSFLGFDHMAVGAAAQVSASRGASSSSSSGSGAAGSR